MSEMQATSSILPESFDDDEEAKRLDALGLILAKTRSEAIDGRHTCGIEDEWLEDEEYYEGIDDANRKEMKAWRSKPLGQQMPDDENDDTAGSSIFMNITRPYCDAAAARVGDMLLPTDDRSWSIKPTPVPDLIDIAEAKMPKAIKEAVKKDHPEDPQAQMNTMKDLQQTAIQQITEAKKAANRAQDQIWDWHVESQYHAHNRRVIEDMVKTGTGVLKGPIPTFRKRMAYIDGKLKKSEKMIPGSVRINYRNFFPDPACGENIHNGNYVWERDDITRMGMYKLKKSDDYIVDQINLCLQEGPTEASKEFAEGSEDDSPGLKSTTSARRDMFEIWYYHGMIKRRDLIAIDYMSGLTTEDLEDRVKDYEDEDMFVSLTMVNNRVIMAELSPLEDGEFPYDVVVWQRRMGLPWGSGVARHMRPAQRVVAGAFRHLMDNAGVAAGPMVFIADGQIEPAEDPYEIRPWKIFLAGEDWDENSDIRKAMQFFEAPMRQEELQAIIELGLKFAEDITGLPMIMQGQTNQRTPETLGGMQMQNNNASTVLRRIARNYDDMISEPHVTRYYKWLLIHGEDDAAKGDFVVDALGSSALVERDIVNQSIMALGPYTQNPAYDIDPRKWMTESLKAQKLDAHRFKYDDEEWKQIQEGLAAQAQGSDTRVQVAEINANRDVTIQEMKQAHEAVIVQFEKEIDVYLQEMREEGSTIRNDDNIKQKLKDTTMKLRTQLAESSGEYATPAFEPPGRAPDGQSFSQ
jgi:hypothetical protein